MPGSIPALNLSGKPIISSFRYYLLYPIYFSLLVRCETFFSKTDIAYNTAAKSRPSVENIGKKMSLVSSPAQPHFLMLLLPLLSRILQKCSCY